MWKRIIVCMAVVVTLLGADFLLSQEKNPGSEPEVRRRARSAPRRKGGSSGDHSSVAKTKDEEKILAVLKDMYENQRNGMMNVPPDDGRILRILTEAVGAKHVVEIGTSNGYSAIWICLGLRATGGKLTTHEFNAPRAALARENFKRAGVDQMVTLVEGDAHKEVLKLKGPIDVVFIDADKAGYIDYLQKLLPLVRPGGLILAHNVPGVAPDYVKAITTSKDLETSFYRMGNGLGITLKKRDAK